MHQSIPAVAIPTHPCSDNSGTFDPVFITVVGRTFMFAWGQGIFLPRDHPRAFDTLGVLVLNVAEKEHTASICRKNENFVADRFIANKKYKNSGM